MALLCLGNNSRHIEHTALMNVCTPRGTRSWVPIPHHALMEGVRKSLESSKLKIIGEEHGLSHDDNRYFGLFMVRNGTPTTSDYGLVVGLRNSHDKRFAAGLACGARVSICDNLSFCGEVVIARKHTRYVSRDLPRLISNAVSRLGDFRRSQDDRFRAYRETKLTNSEANDLLIAGLDTGVISSSRIEPVLKEWRFPGTTTKGELCTDCPEALWERSAWRLFNAFTTVLKDKVRTSELSTRTIALHGMLDAVCGLATKPAEVEVN